MDKINKLFAEVNVRLSELAILIDEIDVSEKVGEDYIIRPEFEMIVSQVNQVREFADQVTMKRVTGGSLDRLEDKIKDKLKEYFKSQAKQKKYEGGIMEMGYKVVERKEADETVPDEFMKVSKSLDTKKVNAYIKATKSDENPDGLLPQGVHVKTFEYITYKPVING
ncbi:hypothetical protein KC685_05055 [Candidatus Dojkabacteria bacterium]|uniref:Uncharacterized protein n=1 Tax=Candidatus Dojkabacteria bacterium TaxID=2099670 RepID=A0A955I2F3_9BACT|nr:hypothetical protein [Candidatus Dojkabacteria bacterium]